MFKKILLIIFIVFIPLLLLSGCSSDDPATNETQSVDLVEPPEKLTQDSSTSSQLASLLFPKVIAQTTANSIIDNRLDLRGITNVTNGYEDYGEEKINNIINIEENTYDHPLKNFNLTESGDNFKEMEFDIIYSSSLEAPYDQIYDYKYILKNSNNSNIISILYKDYTGNKINYIEKYDRSAYDNDQNYFQIIHNENENLTKFLTYENADSEVPSKGFVTINEKSETKEYKMSQIEIGTDNATSGSFTALENLSTNNLTAVFYYKGSEQDSNSEFYDDKSTIISNIESGNYFDPQRISSLDGLESTGDYDFVNITGDYNTPDGYPNKEKVIDVYKTIIRFNGLYNLNFNFDNFEYNSPEESLVENIEIQ